MAGKQFITINDQSGESTTATLRTRELTALNYDVVTNEMEEWRDAVVGITLGTIVKEEWGNVVQVAPSGSKSPNPLARRELKGVVRYTDNVNFKAFTMELGTIDPNLAVIAGNEDYLDLTVDPILTFVAKNNTSHESPYGNPTTVQSIEIVGRTGL